MKCLCLLAAAAVVAASCYRPGEPLGPLRETSDPNGAAEFVVIGDFGTGGSAQYAVADAVRRWADDHPVDALVTTGDNIYQNGSPGRFDEAWERPYGWLEERGVEVVASLGNHDIRTFAGIPVMMLLGMPGPWYAHRLGPVELVVLDGNSPEHDGQRSFMAGVLAGSTAAWQVVVVHHAPYSCADEHGGTPEVRALVPAMARGGTDLVLSGHDHVYQRFPPIEGITFVVSGGGGAPLDRMEGCPADTPPPAASLDEAHHFLYVRATDRALSLRMVRVPGSTVGDTVTLPR